MAETVSLWVLVDMLHDGAQEMDIRARRHLLRELEAAAQAQSEHLPGNPSLLALMPETQLAPETFELELPVWLTLATREEGPGLDVALQPGKFRKDSEALLKMTWGKAQTSEIALRYRDEEIKRLVFEERLL